MPLFPSPEWMDAFTDEFRAHDRASEAAEALDGVFRFVIDPAGPLPARHVYDLEIRPTGNGAPHARRLDEAPEDPRLTLSATYLRWHQLITGQLDVRMAVVLRRVKVRGDLQGLIRDMSSAAPLTDSLHAVDTEWL
jgi:hypothetical protein